MGVIVPSRFEVYREVSLQIRAILAQYTPLIEPLSLDEAYLVVIENLKGVVIATDRARNASEDQGGHRPQRICQHLLKQVSSLNGERPEQAAWPNCDHAKEWPGLCRGSSRQEIPRCGTGDGRADETAWH